MNRPNNLSCTFARVMCAFLLLGTATVWAELGDKYNKYGNGVSDAVPVRIGELTGQPEDYVNQQIKVIGLVQDVCPKKGCWVEILEAQSSETLRFKVQDDVITFPVTAKGQEIVAEGVLRAYPMSASETKEWYRHLAEERGEVFDEKRDYEPLALYQLEGEGALLQASNQ